MTDRKKTSHVLPVFLLGELDRVREKFGLSRSAMISTAVAFFLVRLSRFSEPMKRRMLLRRLSEEFHKLVDEERDTL